MDVRPPLSLPEGARAAAARLLRLVLAGTVLLGSAPAKARPSVTVAEFVDATRSAKAPRVRIAVVKALEDADLLEVIAYSRLTAAAARKRLKSKDLLNTQILRKLAKQEGAQTVVLGRIAKREGVLSLTIGIVNLDGKELWAKTVALDDGELSPELAKRFAAAIAAANGVKATRKPEEPAPTPEVAVEQEKPKKKPAIRSERDPEEELVDAGPRRRRPTPAPESDGKKLEEQPEHAEAVEPAHEEGGAAPPLARLTVTPTLTWRSYRFCPEVANCEQPSPSGAGSPVKYATDTPYSGFLVEGELFPLHAAGNLAQGLGLGASFGRSFALRTHYLDTSRVDQVFGSAQQRLRLDAIFRLDYQLEGAGEGHLAARVGYFSHVFSVDENPKIVESRRSGLILGLEATLPLTRYVTLEVDGALVPLASPGELEKQAYGISAQGGGFALRGGLSSDFARPELGFEVAALFEALHFGDRFQNLAGNHPEFGRGLEDYSGLQLALRKRF